MSVALAPHGVGARPVVMTLRVRYEMQCSWPGRGSLAIRFPPGMILPARFDAGSVLVDGARAPSSSSRSEPRALAVALPKRPQILCDSISFGTLVVTFTRGARLGLPKAAGSYIVRASHGSDRFTGRFTVTR